LRAFNDWRKNPRFKAVLNELMRPVYNGADWQKNEGPWSWMFVDERKTKALLFAINHLKLSQENAFLARLRWLDSAKTYLVEDITMLPGGKFNHRFCGTFSGAQLKEGGLSIDLNAGPERCAAFWIQEKLTDSPQVLYADAAVTSYTEKIEGLRLKVVLKGTPGVYAEDQAAALLPSCTVAIITATTLLNNTLPELLEACRNCRAVAIVGATTPLAPEVFKQQNVTLLSGIVVTNSPGMLRQVSEGGGMGSFKGYIEKVNLPAIGGQGAGD